MKIKNVSSLDLINALNAVNEEFGDNVTFKRRDAVNNAGTTWNVTLSVKDSRGPGGRRGHSGRRIAAACWHVYGKFCDALPSTAKYRGPVLTGHYDRWGRAEMRDEWRTPGAPWTDWNIGSIVSPLYYSDACDCDGEHDQDD